MKELKGFFHKVPTGHCAELFSKVFTLYPVNIGWANCFRTHNEPTVRATLPYCSQRDSASYLARLVPLVTSGRLILDD